MLWPDWLRWAWIGRIAACEGPHRGHERAAQSACGAPDRVYLALHDADVGIGPTRDIPMLVVSRYTTQLPPDTVSEVAGTVPQPFSLTELVAQVKRAAAR